MRPSSERFVTAFRQRLAGGPQRLPVKDAGNEVWAILDDAGLGNGIGFLMRLAQLVFLDTAIPKLKRFGLSPVTMTILQVIRARPGIAQQRVADTLRIKKANLTPLIQELTANGFVSRRNSGANRRAYALVLTAKGIRTFERAHKAVFGDPDIDNLTRSERQALIRLLRKIVRGPGR